VFFFAPGLFNPGERAYLKRFAKFPVSMTRFFARARSEAWSAAL
jgi:hypothetical protein